MVISTIGLPQTHQCLNECGGQGIIPRAHRPAAQPKQAIFERRVVCIYMLPLTSTMATKMSPLPTNKYIGVLALLSAHSFIGGYYAATQPAGA